ILVVGLAACTEGKPPAPPTEQQIHSSDSAVATGEMGRHPYRCSDGEPLFVDYKDNGLQIDLRRSSSAVPITLTAPAQGLQYVGETATATFKGSQLTVVEGEGRTRICEREGTR
ncbi:MliC family protein, partial [Sphingomonas citri]